MRKSGCSLLPFFKPVLPLVWLRSFNSGDKGLISESCSLGSAYNLEVSASCQETNSHYRRHRLTVPKEMREKLRHVFPEKEKGHSDMMSDMRPSGKLRFVAVKVKSEDVKGDTFSLQEKYWNRGCVKVSSALSYFIEKLSEPYCRNKGIFSTKILFCLSFNSSSFCCHWIIFHDIKDPLQFALDSFPTSPHMSVPHFYLMWARFVFYLTF